MIEIKISYDTDPELALENTPFLGAAVSDAGAEAQHRGSDRDGERLPTRCRSSRWPSAGSSLRIRTRPSRRSRPYVDAGLNHLVFHAPGHDQKRFLELFERDLAPRLRALG